MTLFRILSVLEDNQIIHTINLDNGYKLYALCNNECSPGEKAHTHNHIHFQCDDCTDVICLPVDRLPTVEIPNYIISSLKIHASGVCSSCNV